MKNIIETKNLTKEFKLAKNNKLSVLKDINLSIKEGEFVSVMGPSGSGKSTLLYNISGMDNPTSGKVIFDGENISTFKEKRLSSLRLKKMGFVFQNMHLLKDLSILDNILIPAALANSRKECNTQIDIRHKAEELMQRTDISKIADKSISQVSGGELQRAAICRALINNPYIIFGDEPTGALNSASSNQIMNILNEVHSCGTTIMLVTHDIKVAARTERIIFMMDGEIKGEIELGKCTTMNESIQKREMKLSEWLVKQGF